MFIGACSGSLLGVDLLISTASWAARSLDAVSAGTKGSLALGSARGSVGVTLAGDGAVATGGGGGGAYRGSAAVLDLLGGLLARVPIEAPPADEQAAILAALYLELAPLVPAAMETLAAVHAAAASYRHVASPLNA